MSRYTPDNVRAIVNVALKVTQAAIDNPSRKSITMGSGDAVHEFDLQRGLRCAEFVRECVECGMGWAPFSWRHRGVNATEMCRNLDDAGYEVPVSQRQRGCIIGINKGAGADGHIAIYLGTIGGKELIAENTISSTRGNPRRTCTKRTLWSDIADRVTGVYMLAPYTATATPPPVVPTEQRVWRFTVERDANGDIVAEGLATHFADKQTRTGIDASDPRVIGCSLPRGLCEATKGSPFTGVEDGSLVRFWYGGDQEVTGDEECELAVIVDEGPAWAAKAGTGVPGSAMADMTPGLAAALKIPIGENVRVRIRIIAGSAARGLEIIDGWKKVQKAG